MLRVWIVWLILSVAWGYLYWERTGEYREMERELYAARLRRKYDELFCCTLCYDAFENLSKEEFFKLPRELRQEVPDKCRFCRWKIECDPLEIAAATTSPCGNFTISEKTILQVTGK